MRGIIFILVATVFFTPGRGESPLRPGREPVITVSFGGSGNERVESVTVDREGTVYLLGNTDSSDLPVSAGAFDVGYNGGGDVFIARFDRDLETLLACTYLGGRAVEEAGTIAVDASGNVFVAGQTASADFPVTSPAFDDRVNGDTDFFITCLSPDLGRVLGSTFIGGTSSERAGTLVLGEGGREIYLAGWTRSTDCPTTGTPYRSGSYADWDVYLARLSGDLGTLETATYFGGAGNDHSTGIRLAPDGRVYLAWVTNTRDLPQFAGVFSSRLSGYYDIAISIFDHNLSTLLTSTYFGGRSMDDLLHFSLDYRGNVLLGGHSNTPGLPVTPGAFDTRHSGEDEGFISLLSGDLRNLLASSYLGGTETELSMPCYAAATDETGRILVTGPTTERRTTTLDAFARTGAGGFDALVYIFNDDLGTPVYASYFGGSGDDIATAVATGRSGTWYLCGNTDSRDFPITVDSGRLGNGGGGDIFIIRLEPEPAPGPPPARAGSAPLMRPTPAG